MKSSRTCVYMVDSIHEISAEGRGEVERMLQGELYDPSVKALAEMRDVMQEKQRRYSNLNDRKERTKMIKSLFYSTGEDVTIEPNFFADYGKFISVGNDDYIYFFSASSHHDISCHITSLFASLHLCVGERFYANFNCCFLDGGGIEIGDDVMLAPNVSIYTAHHPLQSDIRHGTGGQKALELCHKVKIGNRVWVGGHAIINPGVTIGMCIKLATLQSPYHMYYTPFIERHFHIDEI